MNWNKEKAVFAAAAGLATLTVFLAAGTLLRGVPEIPPTSREVEVRSVSMPREVAIPWTSIEVIAAPRNPFAMVTDWRGAAPDPLPRPHVERLRARVPLPPAVSDSTIARWPREKTPPVPPEDEAPAPKEEKK
ncbi:MAG: hypothetical protein L0Z55_04600 [Planctomycetes bacterium]|nr:hypothetical protein [Planctomycetota bacterium]